MDLVRQSLGITLVFALLWLALRWVKRRGLATQGSSFAGRIRRSGTREMEVLERLFLGPQHSIQLVRVGQRTLVLGTHPGGISMLTDLRGGDPKPKDGSSN